MTLNELTNNQKRKEFLAQIDVIVAMGVGVLIGAFGVIAWLLHD